MSNFAGTATLSSTGSPVTLSGFGFQPNEAEFHVGAKTGTSGAIQVMRGYVDSAGNEGVLDDTFDGTNRQSRTFTNKCISVWEWNGSTYIEVLAADFHSYHSDGIKLNVTTANSNYQVHIIARN